MKSDLNQAKKISCSHHMHCVGLSCWLGANLLTLLLWPVCRHYQVAIWPGFLAVNLSLAIKAILNTRRKGCMHEKLATVTDPCAAATSESVNMAKQAAQSVENQFEKIASSIDGSEMKKELGEFAKHAKEQVVKGLAQAEKSYEKLQKEASATVEDALKQATDLKEPVSSEAAELLKSSKNATNARTSRNRRPNRKSTKPRGEVGDKSPTSESVVKS